MNDKYVSRGNGSQLCIRIFDTMSNQYPCSECNRLHLPIRDTSILILASAEAQREDPALKDGDESGASHSL